MREETCLLTCDAPGCRRHAIVEWHDPNPEGWTFDGAGGFDYCPDHKP